MCKGMGEQTSPYDGYLDLEITALSKHNISLAKSVVKPKERVPLAGSNHFLCIYFSCNSGKWRAESYQRRAHQGKLLAAGALPSL